MQVGVDRTGKVQIRVPASITCFFTPHRGKDACNSGSYGVGIAIDGGAEAIAYPAESFELTFEVVRVKTVEVALKMLKKLPDCRLMLKPNFPVGCGFGMSASLTLSALMALNAALSVKAGLLEIADIAHKAEVISSTGLGDVTTQVFGGVLCRLNAKCPSMAKVKKLRLLKSLDVLVLGKMDTETALEEYDFSTGIHHLKEFLKKPGVEELFYHSKAFAIESGVMDDEILDVVEAVEAEGGLASMVMLGKAVFAVNGFNAMKEFGEPFKVKVAEGLL